MNSERQNPLLLTTTLSIWLSCLIVGAIGLVLHYPREHVPAREPPPIVGEAMKVDLPSDPAVAAPHADAQPAPDLSKPPPIPEIPQPPAPQEPETPPDSPQLAALMIPAPAPVFAVPVQAPRHTDEPKKTAPAQPSAPAPVRRLTLGVGEGQQPNPQYPREAVIAREQGTVGIRFTVGGDGRVLSADIASGSRWPLLNQAALRVVRDRWRFGPGPVRFYEVSIQFQLTE